MRIFLLNLVMVKRERNEKEKEKKNLPWFLLIKSLLFNQSLFWGRHIDKLANYGMSLTEKLRVSNVVLPFIALAVEVDVSLIVFPCGF